MAFNHNITIEQLNQYLDEELDEQEHADIQKLVAENEALQNRLNNLKAARSAIKSMGLKNKINSAFIAFKENTKEEAEVVPITARKSLKPFLYIAATVIVLVSGYIFYQFTSTTNESVFNNNYIAYHLPVKRSTETSQKDVLDSLYATGDYNGYVSLFESIVQPSQKQSFLAGIAYLNTNKVPSAITVLQNVDAINKHADKQLYQHEAEFYLLLAFIKNNNVAKAKVLRSQILNNTAHPFYKNAAAISNFSLRIIEVKN